MLQYLYFLLPAGFANMAPILVKSYFKNLAIPIDFKTRWNNKPLLGTNKTVRGFFAAIVFGIIGIYMQQLLYGYEFFRSISLIDYSGNVLLLGFLMGFGTIFGDMFESLIKRQLNIKSGAKFIPFDQIDWVLGMIVFTSFIYTYNLQLILWLLGTGFLAHIVVRIIGYITKINKEIW